LSSNLKEEQQVILNAFDLLRIYSRDPKTQALIDLWVITPSLKNKVSITHAHQQEVFFNIRKSEAPTRRYKSPATEGVAESPDHNHPNGLGLLVMGEDLLTEGYGRLGIPLDEPAYSTWGVKEEVYRPIINLRKTAGTAIVDAIQRTRDKKAGDK